MKICIDKGICILVKTMTTSHGWCYIPSKKFTSIGINPNFQNLPGRPNTTVSFYSNHGIPGAPPVSGGGGSQHPPPPSRALTLPPNMYHHVAEGTDLTGGESPPSLPLHPSDSHGRHRAKTAMSLPNLERQLRRGSGFSALIPKEEEGEKLKWVPSLNIWMADKQVGGSIFLTFSL